MKMAKTLVLPVLVTAALAAGAGPAVAQLPAPPPLPALPTVPPPPPVAAMFAEQTWPGNETKQDAFRNMTDEINTGWVNGGQQRMMIGSFVGLAIGCVSIFPNFMAGCMLGNVIGAGVGAVVGIDEGNPNARPAVEKFFATP